MPDTKPSGSTLRNAEQVACDEASASPPANLPMGTPIIPRQDLIPASVRRASGVSAHQPFANPVIDGHTEADRVAHIAGNPEDPRLIDLHSGVTTMNMDAQAVSQLQPTSPTSVDATPPQAPKASTIMGLQAATLMQANSVEAPSAPSAALETLSADNSGRDAQPTAPLPIITEAAADNPAESLKEALSARGPRIVKTAAMSEQTATPQPAEQGTLAIGDRKEWKLPPRYLVQNPPDRIVSAPQHVLVENAHVLEQKLEDFNIKGEVTDIRPGPVVTTYEYKPAPGVKISKIVNLKDDLTMSLSALRVRVVAPIPGRDVVGIEVPNKQRQIVYFREVLESENYTKSKGKLTLILGKDIEGTPVVTDLTKAPHMLVAGATGTGKSVGINTFLASMLFKASPDEVKFIMIDPKVLELSIYEGIPHLLLPPIDEPHKAELALKWAVREMDRRYRVLANVKVRSIAGYHAKMPELRENVRKKRVKVVDGKKRLVDANSAGAEHLAPPAEPEEMPYIVVVIDEFADLIMASGKEVERAVARLAQKARACGIHVILATQRPSTDVITGMIKANFPTRVSFQVASSIDSKVVLNGPGAESLLGMGDLLFLPPGSSHLTRCHGTWITDDEVAALADHWKDQGTPNYDMSILEDPEVDKPDVVEEKDRDTRFNEAVQIVWEAQQISVSFLQRKMGIGYGRSARIVDQMEAIGLIGPARGPNKPRELLMTTDTASGFIN
ncbi:MAG TPA: cell division protein FtsK [Myxococcales bacterium]|nr:cell division protein FtsK [Myxococcales bacterium]